MAAADRTIARAAEVLNAGEKVAILVGQGARGAADEVRQVADLPGAGVAKALLGKDVLPDDLPYVTGSIGLLGTRPSYELMPGCDTLLIVGSNFPYSQFLPEFGQGPWRADRHGRPAHRHAVPDRGQPRRRRRAPRCAALIPLLERKEDRSWREKIEKNVARWWEVMERQAMVDADPVNPMRIVWELSAAHPRGRHRHRRLGFGGQLVRPAPAHARPDARLAVRHARDDGARGAVRDRREVRRTPTGRSSPSSATARCR